MSELLKKQLKYRMIAGKADEQEESKSSFIVQKVIGYMKEQYPNSELSILTLAEYVYLTPTYLSNLFKKQTGVTIGQFLTDLRIDEARRLLRDPQYKLYQVSELVGYKDPNYFAKIFKKKTGYTPSEYREGGCV